MSDRVRIQVEATDNASDDFQRIGRAAQQMGQQVTTAGKNASSGLTPVGPAAKNAERALKETEAQAKKTAESTKDLKEKWTDVGAAAGTLVTGISLLGRAYVDQERQIDGLERAYGDASDQLLDFAEQMQETTVYSNDAARAATLSAASLAQNYGLTADQIEEVVRVSADLATVTGVDLQDATMRVAGAIRGEGEAAELLGLNMSDAAVAALAAAAGLEGWNTTMTEGEKAAFRYTVAMDQAAFATGAAADAAQTNAGNARQFVNSLQDQAQALGGAIGPAAEYASVLGSFALAAPVAGAALGRLGAGLKVVGGALGPLGLIAAGVGAVAVLGEMTDWFGLAGDSAEAAVPPVENLADAVLRLAQTGVAAETITRLTGATGELEQALENISSESVQGRIDGLRGGLADLAREGGVNLQDLTYALQTGAATGVVALDTQIAKIRELESELAVLKADGESVAVGLAEGIIGRLNEPMVDQDRALADLSMRIHQLKTDQITLGEFNFFLQDMTTNFSEWYGTLPQVTEEVGSLTSALQELVGIDFSQFDLDIFLRNIGAAQREAQEGGGLTGFFTGLGETAGDAAREINAATRESVLAVNAQGGALASVKADADAYAQALRVAQDAVVAYIASGEGLLELLYESGKELSGEQGFIGGVIALQNALGALDSSYTILVQGSERLGASTQALADHYSELVGLSLDASGALVSEWAVVDDLLAKGIITQDQYNAAVDATTSILRDNAEVQQNIASIQAQQAPYLAALASDTENYVEALSRQDAQQQRNVLTMMDSNSQMQLAALYAAAVDAEMGNLGSNGAQYVNDMAASLKVTNPLLYDMLVSTGAIKETADGIEFNFDEVDASALVTTLDGLNDTLQDLVRVIDDLNGKEINPKVNQGFLDKLKEAGGFAKGGFTSDYARGGAEPAGGIAGATGGVSNALRDAVSTDPIIIPVTVDISTGLQNTAEMRGVLEDLAGTTYTTELDANAQGAYQVVRDAEGYVRAVVQGNYVVQVDGDNSDATYKIDTVEQALAVLNTRSATVSAFANTQPAQSALYALLGYQGDAYINVYARQVGGAVVGPTGLGLRDGGVVGYDAAALDGIVTKSGMRRVLVGEAGPEILSLPPGSGVIPAPMTSALTANKGGGREMHFHFHAPVYAVDDLQQMIGQAVRSVAYQGQY